MLKSTDFFKNKNYLLFILFIPTLLLYAKTLAFGFTPLDEKWLILDRVDYLQLWSNLPKTFTTPLYEMYYRPLLALSIFLDFKIGGISPFIYHLSNLAWHLLAVFCLFKLLLLFKVGVKPAALFTLLFSLHPTLVHAVAWVPGRNDIMLCVFTLASLIYLKKYLLFQKPKFLALNILFFTCALLTKENAFLLPLLYFYLIYKEFRGRKLYFPILLWIVAGGFWLLLRNNIVTISTQGSSLPLTTRLQNFISGFTVYLGKSFFPVNQSVHPTVEKLALLFGVLAFILLIFLFFRLGIHNRKTAFAGLLMFFILLVMPLWFSSGKTNSELYEHRTYTSLCGLILFLSQVKFNFNAMFIRFFFGLILIFFSIKTFVRTNVYKDADTFLINAIKEQPGYFMFQVQYASYLSHLGKYSEAIPYYSQAIASRPDKHQYYKDRGFAYFMKGDFDAAILDLDKAISINGKRSEYFIDRCAVHYARNDIEKAMKDLYVLTQCCREKIPKDLENTVGSKWQALVQNLNMRITSEPSNADLFYQRAKLLFAAGQTDKGFVDINEAIKLNPQNPDYRKLAAESLRH